VREMATASSAAVPLVVSSRLRLLPSHYSARSRPLPRSQRPSPGFGPGSEISPTDRGNKRKMPLGWVVSTADGDGG
jgi:hypothetical protein